MVEPIKQYCKKSLFQLMKQALYLGYLLILLHQSFHIPCNLLVSDLGVDFRAGNGRMSHHLCDALYRNTCLQCQRAE